MSAILHACNLAVVSALDAGDERALAAALAVRDAVITAGGVVLDENEKE